MLKEVFPQPRLHHDVLLSWRTKGSEPHERVTYLIERKRRNETNCRSLDHFGWVVEQIVRELDSLQASVKRPSDEVEPRRAFVDEAELEIESIRSAPEDERPSG